MKRVLSTKQRNGKRMVSHRWYDFCLPFVFFDSGIEHGGIPNFVLMSMLR